MVKKEKIPLALAMRLSERELLDFFSVSHSQSLDDLKSKTSELRDFVFFVCDYYLNPSHFVENFDRLAKDFDKAMSGKKKTAEFDSVIIVDNALFAGEDFYRELNFKNAKKRTKGRSFSTMWLGATTIQKDLNAMAMVIGP